MAPTYQRIAIIGCGLIGSSLARAVRESGAAATVAVADSSPAVRTRVNELGLADEVHSDARDTVRGANLVVFCTPVGVIGAAAGRVADAIAPGATLTDVGSCKASVAEALAAAAPPHAFVIPGHPVAGTEQSGPDAGFASLFHNRWTLICPSEDPRPEYAAAVARLTGFWERLGARVETMDARHHDLVLAVTSHLPHLIAYNIVGTAADLEEVTQAVVKFSAGGFRDFTRIAASDPTMWRDVFLNNKEAVLETLGRFTEDLQALSRAIRWGEGDKLFELFTRTRDIRRELIAMGQESAEPNFGRDRPEPRDLG